MAKHVSDDQLLSYVTGSLAQSEARVIRDHVHRCTQCQQTLHLHQIWFDTWERTRTNGPANEQGHAHVDVVARVMERIEHESIVPQAQVAALPDQRKRAQHAGRQQTHPVRSAQARRRPWFPLITSLAATLIIVFSGGFDQLPTWVEAEQMSWQDAPNYIREMSMESVQRLQLMSNQLYQWLQYLKV